MASSRQRIISAEDLAAEMSQPIKDPRGSSGAKEGYTGEGVRRDRKRTKTIVWRGSKDFWALHNPEKSPQ